MFTLLNKFKNGFKKTTNRLFGSIGELFSFKQLDAASIEHLESALYGADFGVETTHEIINLIKETYKKEKSLQGKDAAKLAATVLNCALIGAEPLQNWHAGNPEVICLLGVNGVGKTTTVGKLANKFTQEGRKVILGACDTFRAAANEQIKIWAERLKIDIVTSHHGADAAAVAYDAYDAAKKRGHDILILDTAGRLHTKDHLMDELSKIKRVLKKHDPSAPHQSWLVVDGSLGSNSIEQARVFHEKFGLTGLIITKLDGTSRGGALVGIYRELKVPIYFVGLGEKTEDLQPFSINNYVNAIFGIKEE